MNSNTNSNTQIKLKEKQGDDAEHLMHLMKNNNFYPSAIDTSL